MEEWFDDGSGGCCGGCWILPIDERIRKRKSQSEMLGVNERSERGWNDWEHCLKCMLRSFAQLNGCIDMITVAWWEECWRRKTILSYY